MMKPHLIDGYICRLQSQVCIDGRWALAKPLPFYSIGTFLLRFYHAWLVITGKATAVSFIEDLSKKDRKQMLRLLSKETTSNAVIPTNPKI